MIGSLSSSVMSALVTQMTGKKFAGSAAIAQAVGFSLGRIFSNNLFIPLNSEDFCQQWFKSSAILTHKHMLIGTCMIISLGYFSAALLPDKEVPVNKEVYSAYKMVN